MEERASIGTAGARAGRRAPVRRAAQDGDPPTGVVRPRIRLDPGACRERETGQGAARPPTCGGGRGPGIEPGELIYLAPAKGQRPGRGKTIAKTKLVPVTLSIVAPEDIEAIRDGLRAAARREI